MKILKHYNNLDIIGTAPRTAADTVIEEIGKKSEVNESRPYRNFANYAKFLIWQDVEAILSNIDIFCIKKGGDSLALSLMQNAQFLFSKLSSNGFLYASLDNGFLFFDEVRKSKTDFIIYDYTYQRNKITRDASAVQILSFIDDLENAENTLINQAEASDIFTPKELVVSGSNREKSISDKFRQLFGIKRGQQKTAFLEIPLEHHSIGRYDYKINDKIKFQFQKLCKLYMFPEDLFFASTTFNNKSESRLQLCYNYAGYFYGILQQIINSIITPYSSRDFEISFYNVKEWEEATLKRIMAKREEIEFLLSLKEAGFDVEEQINNKIKEI